MWQIISTVFLLTMLYLPMFTLAATSTGLSLHQIEQAALNQAPELKSLRANAKALSQTAVAVGQLSDPKFKLGAMNVPVDTFNFDQEAMTQVQVGIMQDFPKGHSLRYRSLSEQNLSRAEYEKSLTVRAQILLDVRLSWLDLYYWSQTKRVVLAQKKVFRHLAQVTESMLANNKAQQKDVIRAQLELTELDNQLIDINQQLATVRSRLARRIGSSLAKRAQPMKLPLWTKPPTLISFKKMIKHHPTLRTDQAIIAAGHAGVKLAEQQYKPGFSIGAAYGFRQGRDLNGKTRADFLTAQATIDLPLFTRNRQDRRLKASENELLVSKENKMSHYRQLQEMLMSQYATWQQQRKSSRLYQEHLVREAKQYAQATKIAYQNAQTDFPTLARAYIRELNTQLAALKAVVNYHVARAHLLYLEGK